MYNNLIFFNIFLLVLFGVLSYQVRAEDAATPTKSGEDPSVVASVVMTKDYTLPMYFGSDEGKVLLPPEFEYDMSLNQGRRLRIGPFELNEKNFRVEIKTMAQLHPGLKRILSKSEAEQMIVAMKWPIELFYDGVIEAISRDGEILWRFELTEKVKKAWEAEAAALAEKLSSKKNKTPEPPQQQGNSKVASASYVFKDLADVPVISKRKQQFRFCFMKSTGLLVNRICTQQYGVKYNGKVPYLATVDVETSPTVIIQKEQGELKGNIKVPTGSPFSFFAEMATGQSYEFIATPPKLSLMDFAESINTNMIRVVGYDVAPFSKYTVLNPQQYNSLTIMLGFQATIYDPRRFWMTEFEKANPVLYFPGVGGGVFKQVFNLEDIPQARTRPYLSNRTLPGTYLSEKIIYGRKLAEDKINSAQARMRVNKKNQNVFEWTFAAPKKGEYNRSYVQITHDDKVYSSFHELYRAYANELSLRAGLIAPSGATLMGEVAYNHWFESFFGWNNDIFSLQRWGISAKYFSSLSPLSVSGGTSAENLAVLDFDLKYRFAQGLWLRDESTGFMLSYQDVTYAKLSAPMAGVGWFWARSIPQVFDKMFSVLPFMDYPKWVDFEFIYYPSSLKSNITLNNSLSVNFHGQVLWSKSVFGEMGFGVKRFAFSNATTNQNIEINTFYGTLGLGIKF